MGRNCLGLVEVIEVACDVLSTEIKQQCRIKSYTAETCLKVKVRTRTTSSVTSKSDYVACTHFIVLSYELLREVSVNGFKTIIVANDDVVSISTCLITDNSYFSAKCCTNSVTNLLLLT